MQSRQRWQELKNAARRAHRNGDPDEAEKYLVEAVEEATQFKGSSDELRLTLNCIYCEVLSTLY